MVRTAFICLVLLGVALAAGACGALDPDENESDLNEVPADAKESGLTPAVGGGFCCPIRTKFSCDCDTVGGWIETAYQSCERVCDMAPNSGSTIIDEHGCKVISGSRSCFDY